MRRVKPRPLAQTIHKALLTPEEDFVLKRIQGEVSVDELSALTGIEEGRIQHIVTRLASRGAVAVEADPPPKRKSDFPPPEAGTASLDDFAAILGVDKSPPPPPKPIPPPPKAAPPPPPKPAPMKLEIEKGEASLDDFAAALGLDKPAPPPPKPPPPPPKPEPPPEPMRPPAPTDLDEGEASLADFASALGMDPTHFGGERPSEPPPPDLDDATEEEPVSIPDVPVAVSTSSMMVADPMSELIEVPEDTPLTPLEGDDLAAEAEAAEKQQADEAEVASKERNYRQVYQTKYAILTADARLAAARTASGSDLYALCFDPDPKIVSAIMENHHTGLDHIRLLAAHHRTATGLEMISRRQDFLRDLLVERRLLRNPMIGDVVLERVMGPKRILPTYKVAIDRDIPELSRAKTRGQLRKKWQGTATSEERADIVLRTEARCLTLLTGCTFDAKTTQILCARPYASAAFVHNLCKFGAAPPALLQHLYKQPFVRKNPMLKKLLLQHPNMPSDVKRGG
jgi:hypothetical protein